LNLDSRGSEPYFYAMAGLSHILYSGPAETGGIILNGIHGKTATCYAAPLRKIAWMPLVILIVFLAWAAPARSDLREQVFEKVLPNGLKVLLVENHKAPYVTFQVWYRVGSRNEEWRKTGISHMLEHMMFKGTKSVGPEEFSRFIQENGGDDNAFTSSDYTTYFENISGEKIDLPIRLESDRMANLLLRQEDFRTEQLVVIEERRLRTEDNPQAALYEQMEATAFQVQPYHWPVIGWMGDLERLTVEDLKKHYSTYYNPSNAFIVVVGDFAREKIIEMVEKSFGSLPGTTPPLEAGIVEQPQTGERRIVVKKEALTPFVAMAYHVPNLRDPDSYVLEVIASLLSDGKSSRLYKGLVREQRIVLNTNAENSILSRDQRLFYVSAEPLPGKDLADVEKALDKEIERIANEPVDERELVKVKNQIEASFVYGQDSFFYQAMLLGQHEIAWDWRKIDDYLPSIRKVTGADIVRVAKKYLVRDNRCVALLVPLPIPEGKQPPAGSPVLERITR
jgi:zinc protease